MATVTITKASRLVNKSTQTLYRHIKSGKLSRRADKLIDTAELIRCYGALVTDVTPHSDTMERDVNPTVNNVTWLENQIIQLQDDMKALRAEGLERERQALERESRLMALLEHDKPNTPKNDGIISKWFK